MEVKTYYLDIIKTCALEDIEFYLESANMCTESPEEYSEIYRAAYERTLKEILNKCMETATRRAITF